MAYFATRKRSSNPSPIGDGTRVWAFAHILLARASGATATSAITRSSRTMSSLATA